MCVKISSINTNIHLSNRYNRCNNTVGTTSGRQQPHNNFAENYDVCLFFFNNKNIIFKRNENKTNTITSNNFIYNINYVDENILPTISVSILARNEIPMKLGGKGLYLMALNDSICEKQTDKNIKSLNYSLNTDKRTLELTCPASDINKALNMIKSDFIHNDITPKHLENVKKIASTGLFLSRKTGDFKYAFDDIPEDMLEGDYEKMIEKITMEDLKTFNSNFISNSDIELNITLNKKDYEKYKDNIAKYFDESWSR